MSGDVCVRPYRPGDEDSINRGFNEVFGAQRTVEEWRWKFGLAGQRALIQVAERDGEVVGHFAAVRARCRWRDRDLVLGQTVDVYTLRRPELVQARVFERLVHTAYEAWAAAGLDGVFGFPGDRHLRLGLARLDYCAPRPVLWWTRAARPNQGLATGIRSGWPPATAIDELWANASRRLGASFARDAVASRDRFTGRPGVVYHVLAAWRWWGRLEALVVVRADRGRLEVADLIWDGRRPQALERLDRALDSLASACGANLELWFGGDPLGAAELRRLGWVESAHPQGLCATAKSLRADLDARALVEDLFVTMQDADLV